MISTLLTLLALSILPHAAVATPTARPMPATAPAAKATRPALTSPAAAIDSLLSATYPSGGPGAAVIVVKDGRTLLRKGYGMADLELGVPVDPGMVFRIGSVTKQFTAAAVMLLVQQGRIGLDDDITKYLPDFPTQGKHISIEHLLTHTSGLKSYTNVPSFPANMRKDYGVSEMVDLIRGLPVEFAPGERWAYNNSGYFLLGAIIEKVSGMTWQEFLKKSVFDPLGMTHTLYGSEAPVIPRRAHGYEKGPDGWANASYLSMTQPYAAGALLSNVDDLARWEAALAAGKLLSKESLDRMRTPYKLADGKTTGYGYGWALSRFEGHEVVGHGGGINGFLCHELSLPRDGVFVAVLTNFTGTDLPPEYVARRVAAEAIGIHLVEPAVATIDPKLLDEYAGVYRIDENETRTITREGGHLFSQRSGGPKVEIFPLSDTGFFFAHSFSRLTFTRDAKGQVTGMEITQAGDPDEKETAARVPEAAAQTAAQTATAATASSSAVPSAPSAGSSLVDPALFDGYAGRYELVPGFVISITAENGHLMAQATGQGKYEIFPDSETSFFYKVVEARITFVRDENGRTNKLILHQGGRDMPATRMP